MSRILTVRVDLTLSGPTTPGSLEIEAPGWARRDTSSNDWYPMSVNAWPRLAVGDAALLPVQAMDDGRFSFLCSGPLLIRDGKIVDSGSDDPVNVEAYGLTIAQLAAKVRPPA